MDIFELKSWLLENDYVNEPKKGSVLHVKYPKIYQQIKDVTKSLNTTYVVNQTLKARIALIVKYNGDASEIINNKLTFDPIRYDFIEKSKNSAKTGWDKLKTDLCNFNETYELDETIKLLNESYENYLGRGGDRRLLSEDKKLYQSVFHHTNFLNNLSKNQNKFSHRLISIVKHRGDKNSIICSSCCDKYPTFNYDLMDFNSLCLNCFNKSDNKYPKMGWFKQKYGESWLEKYNLDRKKISDKRVGSLQWYIKKYGKTLGVQKYDKVTNNRIKNIKNLSLTKYSKISQDLFWSIYNELPEELKQVTYFKELNKEIAITDKTGKYTFFPDFVCGNVIIEYDGVYWHKDKEGLDRFRNSIYRGLDYKVKTINENDYNRNNKPSELINKLTIFIKDGNKT